MKKLVIVESPSKAKTIEKYLGKEYSVRASVGHIRDLPKSNKQAIDIDGGFIPHYEISKGKEKVITDLKKAVSTADEVLLATDPDREGEAIAWHLAQVLGLANTKGKKSKVKRVVFHEITEQAVKEAIQNPRGIDEDLRRAQEARRVLDRLVGYDLSGLIWKKVRYGLSAGRVQSPALRILMEREREIRSFIPEKFWVISAETETKKGEAIPFVYTEEPKEEKEADRVVGSAKSHPWKVASITETAVKRKPRPPFTTSTLQQAASSRLGFSPSNTMRIAQKLYEAGLITYMRTDSTILSQIALKSISSLVQKKYGDSYLEQRVYKTKSKVAQEAHEAIRPTDIFKENAGTSEDQRKLYKLIWARAIASQMRDAETLRTKILAEVEDGEILPFAANGSRVTFSGWLEADPRARGEDVELPLVREGDPLTVKSVSSEGKETEPPSRYTEAGLVKELEKRGIGRPSTYASIMQTIVNRGYVEKQGKTLIPTDTGDVVSSFLETNFSNIVSDSFTAEMEGELDEIAEGKRDYEKTLRDFYTPFTKEVKEKDKKIGKITTLGDAPVEWKCPICGSPMIIKLGKSGKFMSCSRFPDCTGGRTMEGVEMKGPEEIGGNCPKCEEGKLVRRHGKFGEFISCSRYPKCKYIEEDEEAKKARDTGVGCPVCKKGTMIEKRGRFGVFYGCSNYPDCKNIVKAKPTGKICPECGSLMMEGTKTIPERCSNKACPNHNPHKSGKS